MVHTKEKKKSIETVLEEVQLLDLLDKDFKSAIANICKELKETMSKELKENMNAKIAYHMTPFVSNVKDRQIHKDRK